LFAFLALLLAAGKVGATVALDPTVVGVGARALGMGRAYVAAAGEPDSIFLNPAALNDLSRWGMTSMYNKLISEVDYILLGGVYPSEVGKLGVGFLGASIGGLRVAHRDPGTGLITYEPGSISYYNNVYFFSYGTEIFKSLTAGANLKFFYQGYSNNMDAGKGFDADLGLLYRPIESISLGFMQRNFLPASLGAKINWDSGAEESLATSSRLGINYLQGDFNLSADYEIYPTISKPGVLKLGAEWWVSPAFAVRAGSDQDPLETNLTAGLSFLYSGFEFDYAYHQYGSISTNVTHTFSLSYGIFKEKIVKEHIKVNSPPDKSIIFDETVTVEGQVPPEVIRLETDSKEISLERGGTFQYSHGLNLGKNKIALTAYGADGKRLREEKIRVLRLKSFSDVAPGHWARTPISILAMENIVSGYPDGGFKPEGNITRAEMCSLLVKTQPPTGLKAYRPIGFKDVSSQHWAAKFIAQAVAEGAVKGYPNGTFKPNGFITRAEGVAIIARFAKLPQAAVLESPFPDVPGRFWAAKEILSAREAGLLKYLEGKFFESNKKLTRAEGVEILSKTAMTAPKVEEMLDFDRGY
jgi:hypothetical protein